MKASCDKYRNINEFLSFARNEKLLANKSNSKNDSWIANIIENRRTFKRYILLSILVLFDPV
jgi:hypothetical protein